MHWIVNWRQNIAQTTLSNGVKVLILQDNNLDSGSSELCS